MVKGTKRHKRSKSGTIKNKCLNQATMYGLITWYEEMFEKIGWMVLAKSKGGMGDKIVAYKNSLTRLQEKLKCKINEVTNKDNKNDLRIMLVNITILLNHANKVFPSSQH
jgi:hypothetical protein